MIAARRSPSHIGTTPAGTEYTAYTTLRAATDAAALAPGGLAVLLSDQGYASQRFAASWVGASGAIESPLCWGPTGPDAVAALFGEGDDAMA